MRLHGMVSPRCRLAPQYLSGDLRMCPHSRSGKFRLLASDQIVNQLCEYLQIATNYAARTLRRYRISSIIKP
ncbi:hypothetical protein DSM110093_01827 [Sulfitobacter sp. DSM 110093]|nr:hypothetical protein DSM110093_01827 [Sulfitobacter sp. DSM 110093]